MPYGGVILDGSVTNTKVAVGTLSGDRLGANFNYAGDMTVQRFCANKCLVPAVTGYSCCCYGGYFFGNCGICACGILLGAMICGGVCVASSGSFAACLYSVCGTALSAMTNGPTAGSFSRGAYCVSSEIGSVSLGSYGYGLCAYYFCCDGSCCCGGTCRCSYAQLAFGDYGLYTPNKAYVGGGLIVAGNAGAVEGSIAISGGCMCYYSSGIWHPICKTV